MTKQTKTRRGDGGLPEMSLLGGFDNNQNSPKTHEYQAAVIARKARVPLATARTIARLAFQNGGETRA